MRLAEVGVGWGSYILDVSLLRPCTVALLAGVGPDASLEQGIAEGFPGVRIVSADPTQVGERTFNRVSRSFPGTMTFVKYAITGKDSETVFVGGAAMSTLAHAGEVAQTMSLQSFLHYAQGWDDGISLLKLDIEGAEYEALKLCDWGMTMLPAQIVIEWHHWLNREGDAYPDTSIHNPYTLKDTCEAMSALVKLGYVWVHHTLGHPDRVIQTTLFVHKDYL